MADQTNIEWCDSTFNPWIGCTKVSPACDNCYAEALMDKRLHVAKWGPGQPRQRTRDANWHAPKRWDGRAFYECRNCGARNEGEFAKDRQGAETWVCRDCKSERIKPTRRRVFCASQADAFDNEVDPAWRADLFALIAATPNLDWLLLTKRIGNAANMMFLARGGHLPLLSNVWLGATICNQAEADRDIPKLLATPAAVRFLSIEPMLGPVDIQRACTAACPNGDCFADGGRRWVIDSENGGTHAECACSRLAGLHWVIVGGESGPKARPMHPDWARSVRDQCEAAGVPFLFKQWGEWCPRGPESLGYPSVDGVPRIRLTDAGHNGQDLGSRGGNDVWMNRAGKKAAGRQLDGRTHDGSPETTHA